MLCPRSVEEHAFRRASRNSRGSGALALVDSTGNNIQFESLVRTGVWVIGRIRHKARPHWIHMDVLAMPLIIQIIANTMMGGSRLPDFAFEHRFFGASARKPAFNELNGAFHWNPDVRRENQMDVVRHQDEFVQQKFALITIAKHRL